MRPAPEGQNRRRVRSNQKKAGEPPVVAPVPV